jgi:Flp pilus assembly protein protease CpaA
MSTNEFVVATVLAVLMVVAAVCDWRSREIPNRLPAGILGLAVLSCFFGMLVGGWWQIFAGLMLAVSVSLPFHWRGGLGGGDVKLLGALGAWLGPIQIWPALFWVAMLGAVLALVATARRQRTLAYGPAIVAGVGLQMCWPGGLAWLAGW